MNSKKIRIIFLEFFREREHVIVPSSSLIPDDPSVLLTTAGMQQFKAYYTGEADPLTSIHPNLRKPLGAKSAASVQKSFRTSDIAEIGDKTHLTFFEMLGNFSFGRGPGGEPPGPKGGYFKNEAIKYAHDFITHVMGLEISYVTIFKGSDTLPKDDESQKIWEELGVGVICEEGMEDVFWGPTGNSGPCGPTTEIYVKNAKGEDIEVWNLVFNQFFYPGSREELLSGGNAKKLEKLKTPGVDTGMGLERLAMVSQKKETIFETDLFVPYGELIPREVPERERRIIIDHLRGSAFLLADGIRPSNKGAGYILRRLIRRVLAWENIYNIPAHVYESVLHDIIHDYGDFYKELFREKESVRKEFSQERERFSKTLRKGIRELQIATARGEISAEVAFNLYQSFGLPFEIIKDVGGESAGKLIWDDFNKEYAKHQELSRQGQERKFGGHGLILNTGELKARDEGELEKVTRLHSATHLLHAALRKVLGPEVRQMGSDITVERTRFDFTFLRKLTLDELKEVEDLVNEAISSDYVVQREEMPYEDAIKQGALHFFKEKYPERVSVYTFKGADGTVFSRELCGGPHVTHTRLIGKFTILKEEASSAGVRRIRASVEPQ